MSGERPLIFRAESVRAILAGTKTQTRRVIKHAPVSFDEEGEWASASNWCRFMAGSCPLGGGGDRLWVRETWAPYSEAVGDPAQFVGEPVYRATWPPTLDERHDAGLLQEPIRWHSPIFMPRRLSRISLEITDLRIERLQEITEDDARAEGMSPGPENTYREAFAKVWDEINAKRGFSWALNSWVFVLSFRRIP